MYDVVKADVLPANRQLVDNYLGSIAFKKVDYLLRSLQQNGRHDDELLERCRPYVEAQLKGMKANLDAVAYELDATNTLLLVTGPGRIEKVRRPCIPRYVLIMFQNLFPLLMLLLERHLHIVRLSCYHPLNSNELLVAQHSLEQVFLSVTDRIVNLEGTRTSQCHVAERDI